MDSVKKEFSSGNFYHCFTAVNYDFPMDGDAKKAFGVLDGANLDALRSDIRAENETTVRKLLKTWEAGIDTDLMDKYFLYELRHYSISVKLMG